MKDRTCQAKNMLKFAVNGLCIMSRSFAVNDVSAEVNISDRVQVHFGMTLMPQACFKNMYYPTFLYLTKSGNADRFISFTSDDENMRKSFSIISSDGY